MMKLFSYRSITVVLIRTTVILLVCFSIVSCQKGTSDPIDNGGIIPGAVNSDEDIVITSYNIEYDNIAHTENIWTDRKGLLQELIKEHKSDVWAIQEPHYSQTMDMLGYLGNYSMYWSDIVGYEGLSKKLGVGIFVNNERLKILNKGRFWFSDTPEEAVLGWDAYSIRLCNWAEVAFKDEPSSKTFFVFSLHLDHLGKEARSKSVDLILDTIPDIAKGKVAFVLGDFNLNQDDANYKRIVDSRVLYDSYTYAGNKKNSNRGTVNNYDPSRVSNSRIDHIFFNSTAGASITSWQIMTNSYNGKYPSDHFPVSVQAKIKYGK